MLAIRLQRVGRKGHAMYRMAVQESRRHPSSGRVVAYVGIYNPHTKDAKVQVELAQKYLDNGAQPSPRVVKLLKDAGVKMPAWVVKFDNKKTKDIRNTEKLRKNRPAGEPAKPAEEKNEKVEEVEEKPSEEVTAETPEKAEVEEVAEEAVQE
ncbi:MAG: 30S ribosomal protein S16 [Candidatus Saccharibacteria bacterium]|nr:30S ribosomal protein S16 [Candidatus Saccharibacteria bacterium]